MFNTNFNVFILRRLSRAGVFGGLLLMPLLGYSQGITLVEYPFFLVDQNQTVRIRWAEPLNATLYYGNEQGRFDHQISISATGTLDFVPASEGIGPGIYYCRISNGAVHSNEFPLYVESPQAPVSISPVSGAVISTISPRFSWGAVPGVPFYHLILSDQPVRITRDLDGNLKMEGANIIYQAITSKTELQYGEPDPSGFFNQVNGIVPPLLNGKTYNWIVLNNYGNNPALSSIVQSGVQSFTVNVSVPISAPQLNAPVSGSQLNSETIAFSWQPVAQANSYIFELFEIIEESGSSSTFPVWQVATTNTTLNLPARQILKSSYYEWQVIALDASGRGNVSLRRNFTYVVPTGMLAITSRTSAGNPLPRVNIKIKPILGSGENNDYLTSDSGILNLNVQPGTYQLTAFKAGFRDTTLTVEVEVNQTSNVALILTMVLSSVTGSVVSDDGHSVPTPQVQAVDALTRQRRTISGDLSGKFRFPLAPGTFQLFATKSGFTPGDTVLVDLTHNREINLTSPLMLIRNTGMVIGKVIDQNGTPIFGVRIAAIRNSNRNVAVSDINGSFKLSLAPGIWRLEAEKVGYVQENSRTISVAGNQTLNLNPDLVINSQAALVSGFISDGNSGIGQAAIRAVPSQGASYQTSSNSKGNFNLSIPAGSYDLYFHREGYIDPVPQNINLSAGQTVTDLMIILTPAPVEVSGFVLSGGTPVPDAIVTDGVASDTSRVNGWYRLFLPVGTHHLQVNRTGYYLSQSIDLVISPGDAVIKKDIELQPQAALIRGRVLSNGNTVVQATVIAQKNTLQLTTQSDTKGEFLFSLESGIWDLTGTKEGFQPASFSGVAVQPGQTISGIEIMLVPDWGTVVGHVRDGQGTPLPLATVAGSGRNKQALADHTGKYQLQLSPGTVTLVASRTGYGSQTKNVTVVRNQTQTVDFSLSRYGTLQGSITDPNGTPIIQALVLAILGNDTLQDFSDYTGGYRFHLPGGTYQLIADKLGYASNTQSFSIQNGQVVTRNLQLQFKPEELARVAGSITLDGQTPLASALLQISGRMNKTARTDVNGAFVFEKLEVGYDYLLRPSLRNHFFLPPFFRYQPLAADVTHQDFVASLYGDLSANQKVSSFDGSLILRISARKDISPYFTHFPRDSLAADVSGNHKVSSFDASLIFRFAVGLIQTFPAEETAAAKRNIPEKEPIHILTRHRWQDRDLEVSFLNAEPVEFFSFDAEVEYDPVSFTPVAVQPAAEIQGMYREWSGHLGTVHIAMAGSERSHTGDTLFTVVFRNTKPRYPFQKRSVSLTKLEFDEGAIPVILEEGGLVPGVFRLSQNYPNPFNRGTLVELWLPEQNGQTTPVLEVAIYNLLGRKVKLLRKKRTAPGYYTLFWHGDSDGGSSLASGVYLLRVRYGRFIDVKKMILVR